MQTTKTTPDIKDKLQTYVIVTVITMLIWLYAEGENVKQQKPFPISVKFVASPGQKLLIRPWVPQQVWVTVRCATSQFSSLQELLNGPIEIPVNDDPLRIEQPIVLHEKLEDSPLGHLGISIVDIQPATLNLQVEQLEPVTLSISPESIVPSEVQLVAPPTLNPSQATVGLPASIARDVTHIQLIAPMDPQDVARLAQNVAYDRKVPILLPPVLRERLGSANLIIEPDFTQVTFTIRKQTDAISLTSVPILLLAPWSEMQRFSVILEGGNQILNQDVELSGPSDVIEKIRQGEVKVWAELRLSADDLESRITTKQLHLHVPENIVIESAIPRVGFTISPNATSPVTPTATSP